MGYHDHVEIVAEEQACRWVSDLTAKVETIRAHLDLREVQEGRSFDVHRSEYRQMLIHYGVALGALNALVHTRKLSPVAYDELRERLKMSLQSKVLSAV